jgi:hypothetical protein
MEYAVTEPIAIAATRMNAGGEKRRGMALVHYERKRSILDAHPLLI